MSMYEEDGIQNIFTKCLMGVHGEGETDPNEERRAKWMQERFEKTVSIFKTLKHLKSDNIEFQKVVEWLMDTVIVNAPRDASAEYVLGLKELAGMICFGDVHYEQAKKAYDRAKEMIGGEYGE